MMFSFRAEKTPPREESREPRPKRAKIGVACNVCKARKTKCDGARPVCGPCAKRKAGAQSCVYREIDTSPHASNVRPNSSQNARHQFPRLTSADRIRHNNGAETHVHEGENEEEDAERLPREGLFGAFSGARILHEASDEAGQGSKTKNSLVRPKPLKELPRMRKRTRQEPSDVQFAIPPRKVADHLLNLYWDFVDSAYPWLDRASIGRAYETLWSTDGQLAMDERALHCLLNLMFATSCVASQGETPLSRYQSSVIFFERAQALMTYELMEMYNFETIQILLLTAVYLQHEKIPQKCFRSIGTAIHIAQELGLHLPETTDAISDPRERDLARQVWNGCVIMDRICAMTFGCALKVPQSLAQKGLNSMVLSGENEMLPSKVNFYISFCRLHHIIGEVLEMFYIPTDTTGPGTTWSDPAEPTYFHKLASLFRIESELNAWVASLHSFFQMPSDTQDPTPSKHITREANILRARFLSVRLLLFRPFLLQNDQPPIDKLASAGLYTDDQLMPHLILRCQLSCIKAAGDMVEFIASNLPQHKQAYILPSNWYIVSYVYMSVTTLLAAKSSAQVLEHFPQTRLHGLLQLARSILKEYASHAFLASRVNSVLNLINENIDARGLGPDVARTTPMPGDVPASLGTGDSPSIPAVVRDTHSMPQDTAPIPGNFDWVDNYVFDWNNWPTFFAHLEGETSPPEGWAIQS